jgi:hypothetical protein
VLKRTRCLLVGLLLGVGCRTWEVRAFDIPIGGDRFMAASTDLTTEEKWGVVLIVGVAIAGAVALGVAASD